MYAVQSSVPISAVGNAPAFTCERSRVQVQAAAILFSLSHNICSRLLCVKCILCIYLGLIALLFRQINNISLVFDIIHCKTHAHCHTVIHRDRRYVEKAFDQTLCSLHALPTVQIYCPGENGVTVVFSLAHTCIYAKKKVIHYHTTDMAGSRKSFITTTDIVSPATVRHHLLTQTFSSLGLVWFHGFLCRFNSISVISRPSVNLLTVPGHTKISDLNR